MTTLPDGEVLARNNSNDFLLGFLHREGDKVVCETDDTRLENVTLYLTIDELSRLKAEK